MCKAHLETPSNSSNWRGRVSHCLRCNGTNIVCLKSPSVNRHETEAELTVCQLCCCLVCSFCREGGYGSHHAWPWLVWPYKLITDWLSATPSHHSLLRACVCHHHHQHYHPSPIMHHPPSEPSQPFQPFCPHRVACSCCERLGRGKYCDERRCTPAIRLKTRSVPRWCCFDLGFCCWLQLFCFELLCILLSVCCYCCCCCFFSTLKKNPSGFGS